MGIDNDPLETREWMESLDAVLAHEGPERAQWLLTQLLQMARRRRAVGNIPVCTDYVNSIHHREQLAYPGDESMELRIENIVRWNAAVMVGRANNRYPGLGGHISTYASAATLYEVGFNHFFRGPDAQGGGDQIWFQGHVSPGIYARAFLEGRLNSEQLDRFRRESLGGGLSSYPHPRLMPDFWQFPTVSMGLGPLSAIYQARFNRYLAARGLVDTSAQRVWAFVGDGETDEPESLGSLSIAAREGLDNLVFVVNCNLQRLDGPVRGNGKIVQELESVFRGNGWNVIKVLWGSEWDQIFDKDEHGRLVEQLNAVVDGEWQKYASEPGGYTRERFFAKTPESLRTVDHLSDDQIHHLRRGGHERVKIWNAYKAATEHKGQPTVILAHTVKGWTLGDGFEARNVTHQMKQLSRAQLRDFRDRLELPIRDEDLDDAQYFHPGADSPEVEYLREHRKSLGGAMPRRRRVPDSAPTLPGDEVYAEFRKGIVTEEGVSTTMAFVRLLTKLLRDKNFGKHIVPIVPDEARTFGMDPLFRQIGIYAAHGQLYEPIDRNMLLYYREAKDGQLLEEGITEAGSMASFSAAGTAYSTHGMPMIPFYIFYSMFGFQRTGDQIWAFGDLRGRGFLLGATAGRTTLNGEGLQHEDGHSLLLASTIPNCRPYEPAFAFEIAVIVRDGLQRMVADNEDIFYYLTLQNENYMMPPAPEIAALDEGILRGLYRFRAAIPSQRPRVQLFGSGTLINAALKAADILGERYGVDADVWSATSYCLLRREALEHERMSRLNPNAVQSVPWIQSVLTGVQGPFVAVSDSIKAVPDQIARWLPGRFVCLGTDGFGMSDTREALRRHFEVDSAHVVLAALRALADDGKLPHSVAAAAVAELGINPEKQAPMAL